MSERPNDIVEALREIAADGYKNCDDAPPCDWLGYMLMAADEIELLRTLLSAIKPKGAEHG
jgi:hypothetical protein